MENSTSWRAAMVRRLLSWATATELSSPQACLPTSATYFLAPTSTETVYLIYSLLARPIPCRPLLGNGNGTFGSFANYNLFPVSPSVNINPGFATVVDLNHDGKSDVAV